MVTLNRLSGFRSEYTTTFDSNVSGLIESGSSQPITRKIRIRLYVKLILIVRNFYQKYKKLGPKA